MSVQPWATPADVALCGHCGTAVEDQPPSLESWLLFASEVLFNATGKLWPGTQTDIVRPNPRQCRCHPSRRGCGYLSEIELDGFPVTAVSEVKLGGEIVPPDLYDVLDDKWLIWVGEEPVEIGGQTRNGWPCCQLQRRPDTEERTFVVDYEWGIAPPHAGKLAAAALGCQLAYACSPSEADRNRCRLSSKLKSVARQGAVYEFLTDVGVFARGQTGLPEVDLWVASLNLSRTTSKPKVIDTQALALHGKRNRRRGFGPPS